MDQSGWVSNSPVRYIAWGQAYDLIVLIYSGEAGESEEQVKVKALDVIYGLGAEDSYKDDLRTTLKIEPRDPFFTMLQTD